MILVRDREPARSATQRATSRAASYGSLDAVEIIRTAGPSDARAILEVERAAGEAALADLFGGEEFPAEEIHARWTAELSSPEIEVLVADIDGVVTGYAAFTESMLLRFGIAPERFGSGLADRLHAAMIAHRRQKALNLWVLEGNLRARRFYERNGWRQTGESRLCEWAPHPREVGYALTVE